VELEPAPALIRTFCVTLPAGSRLVSWLTALELGVVNRTRFDWTRHEKLGFRRKDVDRVLADRQRV
jgi:hypothetical protein